MNQIPYIKLKESEMYCERCNGSGDDPEFTGEKNGFTMDCSKCLGTGKLNWIENVFGKTGIRMKKIDLSKMGSHTTKPDVLFVDYEDRL